ncbi:hypothetical protein NLM33_06540 [Bradyrhizobium sp. CCGUVB1N3]|nr:hypothetical protein [Bradyrhizobium sp. CCGUVB1N3]MCP3469984.1 hypothetical protein [Bradyrhizobium sp. CCGUVB1N3]
MLSTHVPSAALRPEARSITSPMRDAENRDGPIASIARMMLPDPDQR